MAAGRASAVARSLGLSRSRTLFGFGAMGLWIRPLLSANWPSAWRVINAIEVAFFIPVIAISIAVSLPAMRVLEWRWRVCLFLSFCG